MDSVDNKSEALAVMERHRGMLIKLIRAFPLKDMEEGDAWQEIYYQVQRALPSFQERSAISTWLYRVALNTLLHFRRKEQLVLPLRENPEPAEEPAYAEALLLQAALLSLGEFDRGLIIMYLEGFSQKEMAEAFGITPGHAGVQVHRIKKQLKSWIETH